MVGKIYPSQIAVEMIGDNNYIVEVANDGIHGKRLALENIYDMIILNDVGEHIGSTDFPQYTWKADVRNRTQFKPVIIYDTQ